jgi:hypothetical protein
MSGDGQTGTKSISYTVAGAPSVSIASRSDGASFTKGQAVTLNYSCADGASGPGLLSCVGPVASGSAIDTSKPGAHAFTVVATSKDGQSTINTVHYTVRFPSNHFSVSHVRTHADGNVTLDLKLPGPGGVDVFESAWKNNVALASSLIGPALPHRFVFARLHIDATSAGTIHVTVLPTSHGDDLVHHHRFVWIRLWVSYTPTGGAQRNHFVSFLHITHS